MEDATENGEGGASFEGYAANSYSEYYQQQGGGTDYYVTYPTVEGQEYDTGEGYTVEQLEYPYAIETPETWSYSPEDGHQLYLDQLTTDQTEGYYYDEQGNWVTGPKSPTTVFAQEGYWESGQDRTNNVESQKEASSSLVQTVATPPRKKKSKKERILQRQVLLEKEEKERIKTLEAAETNNKHISTAVSSTKTEKSSKKKRGFIGREKAKLQLKLRIAKAIKRNRMPVQIRILPKTPKYLSPMEKYFGTSVECVLSDIFWASMKGDLNRVKQLVETEMESPTDSKLDPWNLHQTPLHWAAKGGSVPVVNYLLAAGANPRSFDENGSLPLHLSCWAGHVDASIVLLRASDIKDLYVQDYDGAMCPLDWINVRSHTQLLNAIEKYQDSLWLPKFVDDLVRGIIRYKIKIFKDPPKKPGKASAKDDANTDASTIGQPGTTETDDNPAITQTKVQQRIP